jgi:hypothetical protein
LSVSWSESFGSTSGALVSRNSGVRTAPPGPLELPAGPDVHVEMGRWHRAPSSEGTRHWVGYRSAPLVLLPYSKRADPLKSALSTRQPAIAGRIRAL